MQAAVPTLQPAPDVSHRLAVSTYPFRDLIAVPGQTSKSKTTLDLELFGRSIVREFGVFGIEPWSPHFASLQPAYLSSLRKSFDSSGLRVVNIPCDVSVKPCGTAAESAAALDTWSQWVDAAVVLGSPSIRVHVPPTTANELTCATTSLGALAEYGESKNIVINLENDDPKNESAGQALRVIQAVNSPCLRACLTSATAC